MDQPIAFLSYTRKDDEFFGGYITAFRKTLENAVQVVTGDRGFRVFQDLEGIVVGENWRKKLSAVIQRSSFFVPMLSPLFFNSDPCRAEVGEFLEHERALRRDDLILPVYFVSTAKLEKKEEQAKDAVAAEIARRQIFDWRETANVPLQEPAARAAVLKLAGGVAAAIERMGEAEAAPAAARLGPPPVAHPPAPAPAEAMPAAPPPATPPAASASVRAIRPARDLEALVADPWFGDGLTGAEKREAPPRRKILWVDDQPANNVWERRALEPYGVDFVLARDTAEAQRLLRSQGPFTAIISDLARPDDPSAGLTLFDWARGGGIDTPYFIYTSARAAAALSPIPEARGLQGLTANPDALAEMVVGTFR